MKNTCAIDFYVTDFRVCDPTNIVHEKMFGFYKRFRLYFFCRGVTGGDPSQRNLLTVIIIVHLQNIKQILQIDS